MSDDCRPAEGVLREELLTLALRGRILSARSRNPTLLRSGQPLVGDLALRNPDSTELRNQLFQAVGRAVYTSQMLESQLAHILAILRNELALQVDLHSLAAPDHKRSLGQLIGNLSAVLPEPFEGHDTLSEALDARNRVVHHFFIRNNDAFTDLSVHRDALTALQDDSRKLSAAAILMNDVYLKLCEARNIDDGRVVVRQFRVADGVVY